MVTIVLPGSGRFSPPVIPVGVNIYEIGKRELRSYIYINKPLGVGSRAL